MNHSSISKGISVLCAVLIAVCCIPLSLFTTPVSAASSYPNTHTNTGNMAADIVAVAITQAGYCEGSLSGNPSYASSSNYQKYGVWYDSAVDNIGVSRAAWCAAFVSWCANQAGVPSSIVKYHAYCPYGVNWFKNQGRFQYSAARGGSYVPKAGDIVYFAPSGSSVSSHIGIVRYASGGYVYTVEGNTGGQNYEINEGGGVFLKSYPLSYNRLMGYGIPAYQDNSGHEISFDSKGGTAVKSIRVKDGNTVSVSQMPIPYRVGFNFKGWAYNPDGTGPYDESMKVSYSFTLYAMWEEAYWGPNNNLMPNSQQLVIDPFNDADEQVWPYFNADGTVTMYNGVRDGWSWPSAHMDYMNSVDVANDAYIFIMKDGTAHFNGILTYIDAKGEYHDAKLSQIAGNGDTDFAPGYDEIFLNFGQYVANQGHLIPAEGEAFTGNVKFVKLTYYVVGELDQYVKLYDMKFTKDFEPAPYYTNLFNQDITQSGHSGSYSYDGGTLYMNTGSNNGYSVTFTPNATINPTEMIHLLTDVSSTAPFNISMVVTTNNGEETLEFRNEFFDSFRLTDAPDALPAGTWQLNNNLNGYYYYHGGTTNNSTIKTVTVSLEKAGQLTLAAMQASRSDKTQYVTNSESSSGILTPGETIVDRITSSIYTVDSSHISRIDADTTVSDFLGNLHQGDYVSVFTADGVAVSASERLASGMIAKLINNGEVTAEYVISVLGDVNFDAEASTVDAREIVLFTVSAITMNPTQLLAADMDGNGIVNTADARELLLNVVVG